MGPSLPGSPPSGRDGEGAGIGLVLVVAGIVLALVSFLTLPWAEGAGGTDDPTFMDIRDALNDVPEPAEVVPDVGWYYVGWAGFAAFGVVALLAVLAAVGLRSGATLVVRTLGVVAALGAGVVHYVGVWQLFALRDRGRAGPRRSLLMYAAYGLMLAGCAVGPRKVPPMAAALPWTGVPPAAPLAPPAPPAVPPAGAMPPPGPVPPPPGPGPGPGPGPF